MGSFFNEIAYGFRQGGFFPLSVSFFDLASLLFLVATVAYLVYLASRREASWKIGFAAAFAGMLFQTLALAFRWIAAGWDHPPFTNLYESLVFFGWGIALVYIVVEIKYRVKIAGAFVFPLTFIAMGIASLSPNKAIEPLIPALQDIWLHLHVITASVGYAAFLVAFGFSLLYLIKDRLRLEYMGVALCLFMVFAATAVTRGKVFLMVFEMTRVVMHGDAFFHAPGGSGPARLEIPGAGALLFVCMLSYLVTAVYLSVAARSDRPTTTRTGFSLFAGSFILLSILLVHIPIASARMPEVTLRADIYSFAMLLVCWFLSMILLIVRWRHEEILEILPDAKTLDRLSYRSIMVAFPIMTLVIVTGAVWANKAWGRYWGWDPKETASLVTWIIYLLYLHTRITSGWSGRRAAFISIIGFVSVVFTYLGVNLVISGLHSYATG